MMAGPSQYPLDAVLGVGAHVQIRTLIGNLNRPYSPAPFVRDHAQNLTAQGASLANARSLLIHFINTYAAPVPFTAAINSVVPLVGAWNAQNIIALMTAFTANPHLLQLGQWALLGRHAGPNQEAATAAFIGIAVWTYADRDSLATAYGNNQHGLTGADWVTLAGHVAANAHADVAAFAGIPAWNFAAKDALATAFALNAQGLTAVQWATLAGHWNNGAHAEVAAFAAIANWNFAAKDALATAFRVNAQALSAAEWITLAGRVGNNTHADAIAFAGIANWNFAAKDALATSFGGNNRGLSAAQWVTLAGRVAANAHADAIAFASIPGWNFAGKDQLVQDFQANARGLNSAAWVALTARVAANNTAVVGRIAHFRSAAWPDSVNLAGANYLLNVIVGGLMYKQLAVENPHITIHNLADGTGTYIWHGDPQFHVRMAPGGANVYDFVRERASFFSNVAGGAQQQNAVALAAAFWALARNF